MLKLSPTAPAIQGGETASPQANPMTEGDTVPNPNESAVETLNESRRMLRTAVALLFVALFFIAIALLAAMLNTGLTLLNGGWSR